ncbi:MAG: beta-eliminating lyase-related protein, partial [Pseudomonadota bacterium]
NEYFQSKKERCRTRLTLQYRLDDGSEMMRTGQWMRDKGFVSDMYTGGDLAEALESEVATLLGKESACWMPTGTMAQLIALRLLADRAGYRTIGWHPSSHHLLHEQNAYSHVHDLESKVISPWERPILASDIDQPHQLAAISIELPVRWIGQTQTWAQLEEIKAAASDRDIPLMMDGARLWETQPHFGRSYEDICRGFSAVYVSMYKRIGAPGGAVLAGDEDLIDSARIWRHRLGGNVFQNGLYLASALMRMEEVLPKLAAYRTRAIDLAEQLAHHPELIVMPNPPQTNLFRVFLPGEPGELSQRRDQIAESTGIWVGDYFRASRVPGMAQVELQIDDGLQANQVGNASRAFRDLIH